MRSRSVCRPRLPTTTRCCATAWSCMTRSMPGAQSCSRKHTPGRLPVIKMRDETRRARMKRTVSWVAGLTALLMTAAVGAAEINWQQVEQAMGRKASALPGGVYKFALPRSDLKVSVDGVAIKPALALGSWVAFQPTDTGAMIMGDLVLTDTEISRVMERLIVHGVEITAIHNHLLRTSVAVGYLHIGDQGDRLLRAATGHHAMGFAGPPLI